MAVLAIFGVFVTFCVLFPSCNGHVDCPQICDTNILASILELQNHTFCDWRITPLNTTVAVSINKEACDQGVQLSNDEIFENIVWNSTNCSQTDNTTVLTGETLYIRTNTTSPPNSIRVSNFECGTSYTNLTGSFVVDLPEVQVLLTPLACKYTISLPKYYTIDLRIYTLELQEDDVLMLRDMHSEIQKMVGQVSNKSLRVMNSSYAEILFKPCVGCGRTSLSKINISWLYCGGEFEENDNITASIGRNDTEVNVNCLFLLKSIVTNSLAFRLENYSQFTTTCQNDFLQIYDGAGMEDNLLNQYCNTSTNDLVYSSTNQLVLRLASKSLKHDINLLGKILQREGCGQKDYFHQGEIVSPIDPLSVSCRYTITTQEHSRIWLVFTNVTLPPRINGLCSDYIQVTDIISGEAHRYCGANIPAQQLMSGNKVHISFYTNGNSDNINSRFQMHFTECGGLLSEFTGTIANLWGTQNIISKERCVWEIDTPGGKSLYLRSNENFTHLCNSSLKLKDTTGNDTDKLCSNTSEVLQLSGRYFLEATSIFPVLTWIACGAVESHKRGHYSVDLDFYRNINESCPLILDDSNIESFIITIEIMDTNCSVYIQINSLTYNLEEESISNLQFQTPVSIHFPKPASCIERRENHAKIFWEACNQTFTNHSGTFASPGYPNEYYKNISCDYTIAAPHGHQIFLSFLDFDVGKSNNEKKCGEDRVEIFAEADVDIHIHCGRKDNDELFQILSSGPGLIVRFVSTGNQERKFKGFRVSYDVLKTVPNSLTPTLDHSTSDFHELKQGLLSYRTTLATTVAMGICIGVLIFIVIALSGFLVRQRKRKGYHNPVLPQASNASTTNMNGNVRKQAYIKKKDSNSLSTPTLKTSRISSVANGQEKLDTDKAADRTEEGVYNHLHEQATKQNAKSKNINSYSSVSLENKEYSKCGYIEKNSVIIGDNEYGTSNTHPKKPAAEVNGETFTYEFAKNTDMSPDSIRTENENERGLISDTRKHSTENDIMGDAQDSKAQVAGKPHSPCQSTENRKTKKEKCSNEKMDNEDGGSLNQSSENKKTKRRKVSNEKTVTNVYSNLDRNSNEYGNWKEISEHLKLKDSNAQGEEKVYSNTESICSNNPVEEIYSNTSSNL